MISKRLRSALYARNPALNSIGTRLDAVHKARQVGKRINLSAEKLDAFTLAHHDILALSMEQVILKLYECLRGWYGWIFPICSLARLIKKCPLLCGRCASSFSHFLIFNAYPSLDRRFGHHLSRFFWNH
jgi:hypothetical protein